MQVRFLFPVLPLFNVAAAAALARTWKRCRHQNSTRVLWHVATASAALACLAVVFLAIKASHYNYPGGDALRRLTTAKSASPEVRSVRGAEWETGKEAFRVLEELHQRMYLPPPSLSLACLDVGIAAAVLLNAGGCHLLSRLPCCS